MMDANRIKELADRLRSDQARQNGISQREMESCSDLLDELSRIKSAALPETASEIEKRHAKVLAALGPSGPEYRDIGTLLDALRAKEARCAIWQKAADRFRHDSSTMARRSTANAQAANEANARYNERVSELIQKVNDVTGERDAARAQLAQAQKEIASLKADAEESRQLRDIAIKSLAARTQELEKAECDKAALVEGIRWYRMESPPFGQPVQIAKWGRDHGALAIPSAEPDQARILLRPGRWLVGERTVQLDAAEYICLGSSACGTCRKCLETKAEQTDKEPD